MKEKYYLDALFYLKNGAVIEVSEPIESKSEHDITEDDADNVLELVRLAVKSCRAEESFAFGDYIIFSDSLAAATITNRVERCKN